MKKGINYKEKFRIYCAKNCIRPNKVAVKRFVESELGYLDKDYKEYIIMKLNHLVGCTFDEW